jgi:hypothetical protein
LSIEWAAGLFEGEGSITCNKISKRKNSIRVTVQLTTCDKDVLERFVDIIGKGKLMGPYTGQRENNKEKYVWYVQNQADCLYVIGQLYPHLGQRRKEKADEMISMILERWIDGTN